MENKILFQAKYRKAFVKMDTEAMVEVLKEYAETCPSRNARCLDKVFCPRCPMDGGWLDADVILL